MEGYKLIIPISGAITLDVVADSLEEAIDILLQKQEELEKHPLCKLNLELDKVVAIPTEPKILN